MTSTMKLIGAGLPRTGTLTQKLALEQLGLGRCYHWVDVLAGLDSQVALWNRALDGGAPWAEIFDGCGCTVDWPGGHFYRELIDVYPDAKVLLSVRDGQAWEPSFRETIWTMSYGDSIMPLLSRARAQIDPLWSSYLALVDRMFWGEQGVFAAGSEPAQLIEQMEAHNEAVKRAVPAERLLVWEVADGWEPLCDFLGVDVPAEPLPHANDRETFLQRVSDGALDSLTAWRERRTAAAG
jgi:Sulfotransferase domain